MIRGTGMKKEKEIDLIAVLFDCLLHWRGALCFLIVGALILGGYSYYKSYKDSENGIALVESTKYSNADEFIASSGMKQEEVAKVETVISQTKYLENLEAYHNFFNYDSINYLAVPEAEIIFEVRTEDGSKASDAAQKLLVYADSNEFVEYVNNNIDGDIFFLKEMIEGEVQEKVEKEETDESKLKDAKSDTCIFEISIMHSNKENCKKLADLMKKFIMSKADSKKGVFVEVIDESCVFITDYDMLAKVKSVEDGYNSTKTSIATAKDAFSDNQKLLFDIYENGIEEMTVDESATETQTVTAKGNISVKYVGIGAVLFLCMYWGVLVLVNFIFNNKLREEDSVEEIYSVKSLGTVNVKKEKKKFLGFVDGLIIKIRDGKRRKFTEEESLDIIASSVKIAASKKNVNEIIAAGCNMSKISDATSKLYEKLASQNIAVSELDNILYNPDNMSKLPGNKACILIEQTGGTIYEELEKEIEIMKSQGIEILGVVTVEA